MRSYCRVTANRHFNRWRKVADAHIAVVVVQQKSSFRMALLAGDKLHVRFAKIIGGENNTGRIAAKWLRGKSIDVVHLRFHERSPVTGELS